MKTVTLRILGERLKAIQLYIDNNHRRLMLMKEHPTFFTPEVKEMVHNNLSKGNYEKLELLDCIDWVKSVEKKDLPKHRINKTD